MKPFPVVLVLAMTLVALASIKAKEATLVTEILAPIIADGKQIGSVKLSPGATVTIVSIQSDGVMISRGGGAPFKVAKEALPASALVLETPTPTPAPITTPTATPIPTPVAIAKASATPSLSTNPPTPPYGVIGHPEFDTVAGKQSAGTAVLSKAHNSDAVYLLTVRHLLGPMGGFKELTPPEKVPSFVHSISLHPLSGGSGMNYSVQGLIIPVGDNSNGPLSDLAAFKVPSGNSQSALELATLKPAIGDRVWVFADIAGGASRSVYSHPIKITDSNERWISGEFEEPNIVTRGASGAPVLNADGKVVGIYTGHDKGDKLKCFMIPASVILSIIDPSGGQLK